MKRSSDEKWKVGDLVQFKSGGPVMAVQSLSTTDNYYWRQWFAGKKLERGNFPDDSLIAAKTELPQAPQ